MTKLYFFRRSVAALLLLACSVILPSSARANITIAGVEVSDEKDTYVVAPEGSDATIEGVWYYPSTHTILLKDATIVAHGYGVAAIDGETQGLNIKLVGESHIVSDYEGIYGYNYLHFINGHANPSQRPILHVEVTDAYNFPFSAIHMTNMDYSGQTQIEVTIDACDLDLKGNDCAIRGWYNPNPNEPRPPHTIALSVENGATLRARTTGNQGVFRYVKWMNGEAQAIMKVMDSGGVGYDSEQMAFVDNAYHPVYPHEVRFAHNIMFEDPKVQNICLSNWDENGDGFLDYIEARLVTSLGDKFTRNSNITNFNELMFFTGLGYIDDLAFNECKNLQQVEMPYNLKTIGLSAFEKTNLSIVTIPRGVETISQFAFYDCKSLSNVAFEDDSQLTTIGRLGFANCPVDYLFLPDKLTSIGEQAFWGNRLSKLQIPASVTYIGPCAFCQPSNNYSSLYTIVMNGYTPPTVGESAFGETQEGYTGMLSPNARILVRQFRLNEYKTAIPQYASYMSERNSYGIFICGEELAEDNVGTDGMFYLSKGNNLVEGVYYNKDNYSLTLKDANIRNFSSTTPAITTYYGGISVNLEGSSTIYSKSKGIVSGAQMQFQDGDTYDGRKPKLAISSQTECIEYDNSNFGSWAYIEFKNMDLTLNSKEGPCINGGRYADEYDEETGYYFQAGDRASVCVDNGSLTANSPSEADLIQNVNYFDLRGCRILRPTTGIQYVGEGSGTLTWTPVPVQHLLYIGNWIVFQDPLAEQICLDNWDETGDGHLDYLEAANVQTIGTVFQGTDIGDFPELQYFTGVTEIEDEAFKGCESLYDIVFPDNPDFWRIGNSAFSGCSTSMVAHNIPGTVTTIGAYAFSGSMMENVTIPASVVTIGDYAFSGCMGVYFEDNSNLTIVAEGAFSGMENWMTVSLPASVTYVGPKAFENCGGVEFTEDSQLEYIGAKAFYGLWSVPEMIPAKVKFIGRQAFDDASGLNYYLNMNVLGHNPATIEPQAFGNASLAYDDSKIFVPAGTASIYKQAWPEYARFIVSPDGPTGVKAVKAEKGMRRGVFTLDGRQVREGSDLNGLPSGLYIVNGKKVTVK